MAKQPIQIDLRRDLPKVREQLEAILPNIGSCSYAAPCAIGVMLPEECREKMDHVRFNGLPSVTVDVLIKRHWISIPKEQGDDAFDLQRAFDGSDAGHFKDTLARLEAKYLTEQAV